jgi:hypothetical protein
MKFSAYVDVSFINSLYSFGSILYNCTYSYMFCTLMSNFVNYVFLLLCLCVPFVMFMYSYFYVCSVLGIPFHSAVLFIVCL